MKNTAGRPSLVVTMGGRGVVAHAGARLLAELADGLGLSAGLSAAMAATKTRRRGHDRGRVLTDLAIAIADGASAISDLRVLADQPDLFGQVASVPTAWRALGPSMSPRWRASRPRGPKRVRRPHLSCSLPSSAPRPSPPWSPSVGCS